MCYEPSDAMRRSMMGYMGKLEEVVRNDLNSGVVSVQNVHDIRKGLDLLDMLDEHLEGMISRAETTIGDTSHVENHTHNHYAEPTEVDHRGEFCHAGHCETEVDVEMERILKSRDDIAMDKLSAVLAEHHADLMHVCPMAYDKLLKDLRGIYV